MKFYAHYYALASSIATAITYALAGFIYFLFPRACFEHCARIVYLVNIEKYINDFQFNIPDLVYGTITVFITVYFVTWIFAHLYNWLTRNI